MSRTPKRSRLSKHYNKLIEDSPGSNCVRHNALDSNEKSPANGSPGTPGSSNETRRGRPSAVALNTLIMQGSTSPSSIKCTFCNRVFPREKSLQAHLRTHTGERPYACDYPRCTRRFAQSGQLKTHQRLHTGEKPFVCAFPNCLRRFTHVNRHCPEHPDLALKRFNTSLMTTAEKSNDDEHSSAVQKWLENIKTTREKHPNEALTATPKKSYYNPKKHHLFMEQNENEYPPINSKNSLCKKFEDVRVLSTSTNASTSSKLKNCTEKLSQEYASAEAMIQLHNSSYQTTSHQQLFSDTSHNASKENNEIPKKRWLREAVLDQQKYDSINDLAQPINWGEETRLIECENQKRPSVLVRVEKAERKDISKTDLQLAMALVELRHSAKYYNY